MSHEYPEAMASVVSIWMYVIDGRMGLDGRRNFGEGEFP